MRSKSGGRRRSSRSCSADRRATSKSRTSEDLQRESRNPDDSSGDPTPNQLRSDGYVGQVVNSRLNKQGHTSNQYLPDNVLNQESTLGRLVNNVDNIAPLHSTPHQQSASGLLRTNPGQNVSIDSVSNQQQDRFISKSNQEVTVHNGSNLPCKDPQNNRKKSGDSILNQSFGPDQRVIDLDTITGHGKFELKKFSSAYSFPNQPHGTGMVTNKTNQNTSIYSTPGQQSEHG
ncbi:hypothetical protein TNIN_9301 [Trichonephila inaurata madagascariensis]|uniref:Uncharacterized protein n=1 Tax=Trichonephila inaurata madagascariensis TaxID=2747483 RepID=A0A8X6WWK0_9ARAC|nr:hypothetical protein TNIN_9301 [Trichonephila inaurata madagascariensis]